MLALLALVAAGGVGRRIHAVAVGLFLGALTSSLYDFIRKGSVENLIGIRTRADTVISVNLAFVAVALGIFILGIGALTGSFPALWQRRRPLP